LNERALSAPARTELADHAMETMRGGDRAENYARVARARTIFGRRKGKALRRGQSEILARALPRLNIDLSNGPIDPAALFDFVVSDLHVEIGFGGGEHLIAAAARAPDVAFVGCEPFLNGLAKAVVQIETLRLRNVRLYHGDANDLLESLPEHGVGRVCLLYPDPWPKRRQRKRRFINDATLARLARVMRKGAELRFATDIDDYGAWTLACVLRSSDFVWRAREARDWTRPWSQWPGTRYEAKALAAGRTPVYLTFVRV